MAMQSPKLYKPFRQNLAFLCRVNLPMTLTILEQRAMRLNRMVRGGLDHPFPSIARARIEDSDLYDSRSMDLLRLLTNLVPIASGKYCELCDEVYQRLCDARTLHRQKRDGATEFHLSPNTSTAIHFPRAVRVMHVVSSLRSLWSSSIANELVEICGRQRELRKVLVGKPSKKRKIARRRIHKRART